MTPFNDSAAAVLDPSGSAWDELWRKVLRNGEAMPPPSPWVVELADELWKRGARHVLDLGCGPGRNTIFLASRGYTVYATDVSEEALSACRRALSEARVQAGLSQEPMIELSLPNKLVEWVLAENVVYHGTRSDMRQAIAEARRVLKPSGWFSATFLSTDDEKLAWYRQQASLSRAEEIEPNTYHALFRGRIDEHVPHTFVAREELPDLLEGFTDLQVTEARKMTTLGLAAYWRVLARRH